MDAFCYGNALVRVIKDGEPDSLLTECADSRRDVFLKITNPTSIMNFKRDTYSQDEDAVKFRTAFFHKMNTDPNFSIELRKKVDMMLSRSFEREEHEASKQNGVVTGNMAETTTGAAAEAPQQGRFAREQNGVGPELTREATAKTAVEGPEQGKVASEQSGVGTGVSEQTEIATGSGEQSKVYEQEDQIQVREENRVEKAHGVNGGVDG